MWGKQKNKFVINQPETEVLLSAIYVQIEALKAAPKHLTAEDKAENESDIKILNRLAKRIRKLSWRLGK